MADRAAQAIEALEKALAGLTPGPWEARQFEGISCGWVAQLEDWSIWPTRATVTPESDTCELDAKAIAMLHNAAPALLKIAVRCHRAYNLADELAELATAVLGLEM